MFIENIFGNTFCDGSGFSQACMYADFLIMAFLVIIILSILIKFLKKCKNPTSREQWNNKDNINSKHNSISNTSGNSSSSGGDGGGI